MSTTRLDPIASTLVAGGVHARRRSAGAASRQTLQLSEIATAIEKGTEVKVAVFDSAIEGLFITHYDFVAPLEESSRMPDDVASRLGYDEGQLGAVPVARAKADPPSAGIEM